MLSLVRNLNPSDSIRPSFLRKTLLLFQRSCMIIAVRIPISPGCKEMFFKNCTAWKKACSPAARSRCAASGLRTSLRIVNPARQIVLSTNDCATDGRFTVWVMLDAVLTVATQSEKKRDRPSASGLIGWAKKWNAITWMRAQFS